VGNDRKRTVASQKRSLFVCDGFSSKAISSFFSVIYTLPSGGARTAILIGAMSSISIALDSTSRAGLLQLARKGDRESLAKLILPYGPALYLGALRLTRNPAEAEDVRQEAFLKAISRLEQFNGSQNETRDDLHAWVSRIAANASIDVIRKRRDGKILSLEEPSGLGEETLGSNVAAPAENPEERFARREMRQHLADAIKELPPELRQVCLLRDVLQYSTQEVAERVGISAMAVRLRLFRAHRRLRERLSLAFEPRKERQAHAPAAQVRVREAGRKREQRIPLGAFAECACGD
jgi:RNA polymerase sigma-70 factor (ECF subfamily)